MRRTVHAKFLKAAIVLSAVGLGAAGFGLPASAGDLTPRDAGARYGQALGALEICNGSKLTAAGDALRGKFSGADNEIFKEQAAKIFNVWMNVKACTNGRDPNQCKIIMDKSCLAAEAEIGSNGTILPGLVEFAKH